MTLALIVLGTGGLLLLRVPVAFALLAPSLGYILLTDGITTSVAIQRVTAGLNSFPLLAVPLFILCLLYTSPSPRDLSTSRMPSSA